MAMENHSSGKALKFITKYLKSNSPSTVTTSNDNNVVAVKFITRHCHRTYNDTACSKPDIT